jgi:2,3-dihydroxybenzoate-AMP ligase/mycobactin salicyl-AMP ligase
MLSGCVPYDPLDAERYDRLRWWPGLTLGDLLDKAADVLPDAEAFVDGRTRYTWTQARESVDRLALGLMELGIGPLDRVLVQLPNWNEFPLAYFALQKIGAVVVLLIDRYRQHEINHLIELTGATAWVVPQGYKKVDYLPIIREVREANPHLRHVILARGEDGQGYPTMDRLMVDHPVTPAGREQLAARRPDPGEVAHMGPTGGTTGLPKVVPRTHNSLVCGAEHCARAWNYHGGDTCLIAGPIGHDLCFTKGLLGGMFQMAKVVFLDSIDMDDVCRTIQEEKVTSIVWVPTLASRLIHFQALSDYDLSSLRKMHCGGGPSLPDMIRGVREKLGCEFFNGYGGTEGQTCITRPGDDLETVCGTVGKPTCPYDTYRIVDLFGQPQPENTSGELVIKGPGVFTGYLGNPEENAKAFTPDGFFRTGDLAQQDARGYITLTGRLKEMINRGGESISSAEVERLISGHPSVAFVAVVPMPDPDLGERVCAFVQPCEGTSVDAQAIQTFLQEKKTAVLHRPDRIEFLPEMPQTKAGKLDKRALRALITEKLAETAKP